MKKYNLLGLLLMLGWGVSAQRGQVPQNKNPFLNASFWQEQPDVEAVKAAIAKGANPGEANQMGFDPIVVAINADAPAASVLYLLEQTKPDVNKAIHEERSYLFYAASKGNIPVMEYLIDKGAKVNAVEGHGMSVLNMAASFGQLNTDVYELLLKKGATLKNDLTSEGANALLLAAAADKELKLVDFFQKKGLSLQSKDAAGNTAFDYAVRAGNMPGAKTLLAKGVKPGANVMMLASQGARRSSNTLEMYQYLGSLGIDPVVKDKNGNTPLHFLVRKEKQADIVQYFLDKGVKVNDQNNSGATALALAVRSGNAEMVEFLLDHGADPSLSDARGNNLVFYLFDGFNPRRAKELEETFRLLKEKGYDVAQPQKDGTTLYHLAVATGDLGLLKMVKELGINVNVRNKEGLTALHKAAMVAKNDAILKYLLEQGADKKALTGFEETAYDLAKENEYLRKENVSVEFLK